MNAKSKPSSRTWVDVDDAPEITHAWIESADTYDGDRLVRRGRPAGSQKSATTIRLDNDVLEAFRLTGKGWQTRINLALKDWLKTNSPV